MIRKQRPKKKKGSRPGKNGSGIGKREKSSSSGECSRNKGGLGLTSKEYMEGASEDEYVLSVCYVFMITPLCLNMPKVKVMSKRRIMIQ